MVDELFSELEFDEDKHEYTVDDDKLQSVTTWIKGFFASFDGDYWSKRIAKEARDEILSYTEGDRPKRMMKLYPDTWEEEILKRKKKKVPINARTVKKLWEANGQRSRDEGTAVHNEIEGYFNGDIMFEEVEDYRTYGAISAYNYQNNLHQFEARYPEIRIYDKELGLAGTVDMLGVTSDGEAVLLDWKTNKKDLFKGSKKAKKPVNELVDCSYSQYVLQLSTYAYILERAGLPCKKLLLVHLQGSDMRLYEVDYRKDLVEEMIKWTG